MVPYYELSVGVTSLYTLIINPIVPRALSCTHVDLSIFQMAPGPKQFN